MEALTPEQRQAVYLLNESRYASQISSYDLALYAKYHLMKYGYMYEALDALEIEQTNRFMGYNDEAWKFVNNTLVLTTGDNHKLNTIRYIIECLIDHLAERVRKGNNVENVYPWAYEYLFEGENPCSTEDFKIIDYYRDSNLAYIKAEITAPETRRRSRSAFSKYREFVIEKLLDGKFRTKNKKALEELKLLREHKKAPKARFIQIKTYIEGKIERMWDPEPTIFCKADVKVDPDTQESYISVCKHYQFYKAFQLKYIATPHIAYNDNKSLFIQFRVDEYEIGNLLPHRSDYIDKFFVINDFGGLIETTENCVPLEHIVQVSEQLKYFWEKCFNPEPNPYHENQLRPRISEDETEIIEEVDYSWVSFELSRVSPDAREYVASNKYDQYNKNNKIVSYYALYGNSWVETTERNKKVQTMFEEYEWAEKFMNGTTFG